MIWGGVSVPRRDFSRHVGLSLMSWTWYSFVVSAVVCDFLSIHTRRFHCTTTSVESSVGKHWGKCPCSGSWHIRRSWLAREFPTIHCNCILSKHNLRLAEIAHSLLKLAPYDTQTMESRGLRRYIMEMLPITDWTAEAVRPALILILKRLDRMFNKIHKMPTLRWGGLPVSCWHCKPQDCLFRRIVDVWVKEQL